jgi:hypothetical protein
MAGEAQTVVVGCPQSEVLGNAAMAGMALDATGLWKSHIPLDARGRIAVRGLGVETSVRNSMERHKDNRQYRHGRQSPDPHDSVRSPAVVFHL